LPDTSSETEPQAGTSCHPSPAARARARDGGSRNPRPARTATDAARSRRRTVLEGYDTGALSRAQSLRPPENPRREGDHRPDELKHSVDRDAEDAERQQDEPDDRVEDQGEQRQRPAEEEQHQPEHERQHDGHSTWGTGKKFRSTEESVDSRVERSETTPERS